MPRTFLPFILIPLAVLLAYLALAPVPAEPQPWQAKLSAGYVGPHAVNHKLAALKSISLQGGVGPEHVAFGPDGALYAAVEGGAILRMQPDGSGQSIWANTGGRVLGFAFDASGRMIAADAFRGLVAISADGRQTEVLLDHLQADGRSEEIKFANAVVVAADGNIYFSDSSTHFSAKGLGGTFLASVLDILEHSSTGRVIQYNPVTRQSRIVLRDLCFANGLALSQDEKSLFVVETGAYRVWKIDPKADNLKAAPGAQAQIVLDNLPGYPDNLMRGLDGRIWLGLAKPRSDLLDKMATQPFLRKVTLRLPQAWWPVPKAYGHVLAFNESGGIVADLQDPDGHYPETTGVLESRQRLYIQSLHAQVLGWMEHPPL